MNKSILCDTSMTNGMIKCTQKETKNKYTIKERKKYERYERKKE